MSRTLLRFAAIFLFLIYVSFLSQAQNCNTLLQNYGSEFPDDTIQDTTAFCDGAKRAYVSDKLVWATVGDLRKFSDCHIYSYEHYGVNLVSTGSLVGKVSKSRMKGFNYVMKPRLIKALGTRYYELGKTNDSWYELNQNFVDLLYDHLLVEEYNSDSVLVKLNMPKTDSLSQIKIYQDTSRVYSFSELYKGVVFSRVSGRKQAVFKMNLSKIKDKDFCNPSYMSRAYYTVATRRF